MDMTNETSCAARVGCVMAWLGLVGFAVACEPRTNLADEVTGAASEQSAGSSCDVDACYDGYLRCIGACAPDDSACTGSCADELLACVTTPAATCSVAFHHCAQGCAPCAADCQTGCLQTYQGCTSTCLSLYTGCLTTCEPTDDDCHDACDASYSTCHGGMAQCSELFGGCTAACCPGLPDDHDEECESCYGWNEQCYAIVDSICQDSRLACEQARCTAEWPEQAPESCTQLCMAQNDACLVQNAEP